MSHPLRRTKTKDKVHWKTVEEKERTDKFSKLKISNETCYDNAEVKNHELPKDDCISGYISFPLNSNRSIHHDSTEKNVIQENVLQEEIKNVNIDDEELDYIWDDIKINTINTVSQSTPAFHFRDNLYISWISSRWKCGWT